MEITNEERREVSSLSAPFTNGSLRTPPSPLGVENRCLQIRVSSGSVVHKSSHELQMRDTSDHLPRLQEIVGKIRGHDQPGPSGFANRRNQRDTRQVNLNKRKAQGGPKSSSIKKVKPSAKELTLRKRIREAIEPNEAEASKEIPKSKKQRREVRKKDQPSKTVRNLNKINSNRRIEEFFKKTSVDAGLEVPIKEAVKVTEDDWRNCHSMTINCRSNLKGMIHDVLTEAEWNAIDIIFISETGLVEGDFQNRRIRSICATQGFTFSPAMAAENKAGHTAMILRMSVKIMNQKIYNESGRLLSCTVVTKNGPINLLGVYQGFEELGNKVIRKVIKSFIAEANGQRCIVLGDFNEVVSEIDYTANYIQPVRRKGKLHTMLERANMVDIFRQIYPRETQHTCISVTAQGKCFSRLDYIYISPDLVEETIHSKTCYDSKVPSDHIPIWIGLSAHLERDEVRVAIKPVNSMHASPKQWAEWRDAVDEDLREADAMIDIQCKSNDITQIETALNTLTVAFISKGHKIFKKKKDREESPFALALRDDRLLHRLKERAFVMRKEDRINLHNDRAELKDINKEIAARRQVIIREKTAEKWEILNKKIRENPSHIYQTLQKTGRKAQHNSEKPFAVQQYGVVTSDPLTVREEFRREWAEVFTSKSGEKAIPSWLKKMPVRVFESVLDVEITQTEVQKAIKKGKKGKATGSDLINNQMLKSMSSLQEKILTKILNAIRRCRKLPGAWKESITVMIYKGKGNKSSPMNFRPIALLSCIYKVYSSIQTERLQIWMEKNEISSMNQHGFRKGTDTADAAAELFACIRNAINANKELHAIFLDVAKAYDSVETWALKQTLVAYRLHQNDIEILINMVSNNTTRLDTAHGLTDIIHIRAGVRQGDIISPTLYLLFLNPSRESKQTVPYWKGLYHQ